MILAIAGIVWAIAVAALLVGAPAWIVAYALLGVAAIGLCRGAYLLRYSPGRRFLSASTHHQKQNHDSRVEPQEPQVAIASRFEQASFLAKVCHELRTPLHNIMGLIQILARDTHNTKTQRHYLQLVDEASQHLLRTINSVLDFSKADTCMLSVSKQATQLDDVVRQALRTVAPLAYQKGGIELLCRFDVAVPTEVDTDGTRLCQVLINLLGNAIKFTSAGCVKLSVSLSQRIEHGVATVLFEVSDTGAGIPQDQIDSVFEPFKQVDMTIVRRSSGTGLGLTIVKQIVSLLGGEVGVSSVLKQGSTFWFSLPVVLSEKQATDASQRELAQSAELADRCVYVVSTGRFFSDLAQKTLAEAGAGVVTFDRFIGGASEAKRAHFYVITEDVLVAEGAETVLRWFVDQGRSADVAVCLSPASLEVHRLCEELGLPLVVSLPVLSKDILEAVSGRYRSSESDSLGVGLAQSADRLHVLIADDLPTNQLILRSLLEDAGHRVTSVSDGDELVAHIARQLQGSADAAPANCFDVVLTDVEMPRLDGISAIRHIRALEKSQGVQPLPLVVVTAHALEAEQRKIMAAGASGIVTKPLHPRDVERVLQQVRGSQPVQKVPPSGATAVSGDFVRDVESAVCRQLGVEGQGRTLLDVRDLFERSGESPRRSLLILRSFMGCYQRVLDELSEAERAGSAMELARVAHALKGLTAEVGAWELSSKAAHLETLGQANRVDDLLPLVPELKGDTEVVAAAIESVLQSFKNE